MTNLLIIFGHLKELRMSVCLFDALAQVNIPIRLYYANYFNRPSPLTKHKCKCFHVLLYDQTNKIVFVNDRYRYNKE